MVPHNITPETLSAATRELFDLLARHEYTLCAAESLTAGLLTSTLANLPGASDFLVGGITVYQTPQKAKQLGVDPHRLATKGPVGPVVAEQMALGAAKLFSASCALATTGVAGPGSAYNGVPAGTVIISALTPNASLTQKYSFTADRQQVRTLTVLYAINQLATLLASPQA